ncbi:hypothetical protein [Pseudomonas borbori]|uniref:hypothetical protein n=1 Tax=Pseudomonas borbori TaxID=289003 RepID=UPI000B8A3366|nr:hypothetical protein [Pseudomonas borbori]
MKKFTAIISTLFFISPAFSLAELTEEQLREELKPLVKKLPMQLDSVTSLTSILVSPRKIILYKYAIDFDKTINDAAKQANISTDQLTTNALKKFGSVDQWLKAWGDQYVAPLYKNQNCTTPATLRLMENGFSLLHVMYDMRGNYLYESKITLEACDNIFPA